LSDFPLVFKKFRASADADDPAITLYLFENAEGDICGWFLGPVAFAPSGIRLPYLPRSEETRGSLAIVRAIEAAKATGSRLCVVDPEDLWDAAW